MKIKKPQVLEIEGKPRLAVVPLAEWQRIVERLEDAEDALAVRRWRANPGEAVPAEVVNRLLDGENKIKVWRMHRSMTQQALAEACGVSKPYISQLEANARLASQTVLRKLAGALRVDVDDLV
ncbi:MAG: helix-turn-helix transcriptional regulator [Alphaproteobacteria bacterium]|nr:helix-turn-helix transcriptional regulator [Alphaproteobacteria bacterium]MBV8407013.1 helix-turn-helix transcriptional regulator [Alphaproteobacteria bacterium]